MLSEGRRISLTSLQQANHITIIRAIQFPCSRHCHDHDVALTMEFTCDTNNETNIIILLIGPIQAIVLNRNIYVGCNLWICDIHGSACAIYGSIVCAEIHGYLRNLWILRRRQIISL